MDDRSAALSEYRRKRDFGKTAEPAPGDGSAASEQLRFTIQEHHARRLHWDLRLERDGVAVSFAIPNGIPLHTKENRLAVHTEDHPLEYLEWEGEIPAGEYGGGTMRIWDHGTYEAEKWEPDKIIVNLHGEKVRGHYALFPTGRSEKDWMIHRMDPPETEWAPMPERIEPMMAKLSKLPPDESRWSFEIKWDGVRAIAYSSPGRLHLESRNLRDITAQYPEVRALNRALSHHHAILDGEIVAFDDEGRPSFERLQGRIHLTGESQIRRLATSNPVTYAIFDLLWLDGEDLMHLPYTDRRERLEALGLDGPNWRTPANHVGNGTALLAASKERRLEGIIAKRLDCPYEPGRRSGVWLKIKNVSRQELVIGGWIPGEGRRRDRIGALAVGYFDAEHFHYAGKVGTGFTDKELDRLAARLAPLERPDSPFTGRQPPRATIFAEPELVAEIEYLEWTSAGMVRAPSYKGLREDKDAREVIREVPVEALEELVESTSSVTGIGLDEMLETSKKLGGKDGGTEVTVENRTLRLTNLDKVLYPKAGFTKGQVIDYMGRMAPVLLPHLHRRPLTLKRYPNGVDAPHFYEKNCPKHRPPWIGTAEVQGIEYCLVEDVATLVWLGNLADLELHTPMITADASDCPTMVVFDLDPGPGTDIVDCCRVGLILRGMFEHLGLKSFAKTSGSKGLQLYLPLNVPGVDADQAKTFARAVAETVEKAKPDLVVSRMTKALRPGKVFIDWSQNDEHKTTICVYSLRAKDRPTVSTPVTWEEVEACRRAEDLTFDSDAVLDRVEEQGDLFAEVLTLQQRLPGI
jgi:bifunctional non-homologous end joining protein LigD